MNGNNGKVKPKEDPRRLVSGVGRNGILSWLLLLLFEGCTQRVVSSYGTNKEAYQTLEGTIEGCTLWVAPSSGGGHCDQHSISQYMSKANEGRRCWRQLATSLARRGGTKETSCEGWTPCQARVPTSHGEQCDSRVNDIEPWRPSNSKIKGCTQLYWGAILIGREKREGNTRWIMPSGEHCSYESGRCSSRNNSEELDSSCRPCEEGTRRVAVSYGQCSSWTEYEGHTRDQRVVASYGVCISETLREGYTCRWQVVTSCGNETDPPAFKISMGCPHNHDMRSSTGPILNCTPGIYHIDDITVDDLMVDDLCLKSQTLTH